MMSHCCLTVNGHHLGFLAIFSVQCLGNYDVTVLFDRQWNITRTSCYFFPVQCLAIIMSQCCITTNETSLEFLLLFKFNTLGTMMSQCCLTVNETSPWITCCYFSSMLGTMISQCCLTINEISTGISCYYFSSMLWELWCHSVAWPSLSK